MSSSAAERRLVLAAWLVASALLGAGTLATVAAYEIDGPSTEGRFREEVDIAAVRHARGRYPFATYPVEVGFFSRHQGALAFHQALARETLAAGIRPWQVWRTVPAGALPFDHLEPVRVTDDRGRVLMLAAAFDLLGGVTPFLLFWLGLGAMLPVTAWLAFEFQAAGHGPAGAVLLLLLGGSPFVVETLALAYSPVGFHVVGLTALCALGAHALLHPRPTWRSLTLRALGAGVVLGVCLACRRASLLVVPGYLLALGLGAWRCGGRPLRRVAGAALLVLLAAAPPLAVLGTIAGLPDAEVTALSPRRRHLPWLNLWEGLGDFDREKGYAWADRKAMQYALDVGGPLRALGNRSERIYRRKVLGDILDDPAWYAGILARRLAVTVSQAKLWPRGGERSFALATTLSEGAIDSYYGLVTTVDHLGWGGSRLELPVALLWGPTLAWLVVAIRRRQRRELALLACVAGAGLVGPVLITTASAIETQAFVLAYFLGAGFLVEAGIRSVVLEQQEQEGASQGQGAHQKTQDHPEDR